MMTIAKGLTSGYIPMGGLIVRDDVVAVLNEGGDFNHGFTYSGHPVAAAVALENIRILRDEKIRSEEHTSELQSLMRISYAVFCLKKNHHTPIETYTNKY